MKRGALLVMEGAAAPEVAAALPQDDRLGDERHDVGGLADALLVLLGYHRTSPSPRYFLTHATFPSTVASSSSTDANVRGSRSHATKLTESRLP